MHQQVQEWFGRYFLRGDPYPHDTAHIVESKSIGLLLAYGMGMTIAIFITTGSVIRLVASGFLVILSSSQTIFPFCFGRKAISVFGVVPFLFFRPIKLILKQMGRNTGWFKPLLSNIGRNPHYRNPPQKEGTSDTVGIIGLPGTR